jgi:hypothetical protein
MFKSKRCSLYLEKYKNNTWLYAVVMFIFTTQARMRSIN